MTGDDKVGISASVGVTVSGFSDKDEDNEYDEWRDTIDDLIRLKKLKHVLDSSFQFPTRTDATVAWTKDEKKLIDDNDTACTWFSFATTGAPKKLIKKKKQAREMLEVLDDEYDVAKEMEDLQVVQKKFDELNLNDGEAPSVFFTEVEDINNKFEDCQETGGKSYKKGAKEMIIKITKSVSKDSKYENIIRTWKTSTSNSKMDSTDKLKDLKTTLKSYYKKHFHLNRNKNGTENVIMTVTEDKFCGYCGKKGHNETQCWKKHPELRPTSKGNGDDGKNSSKAKKKGPCWICGGHYQKKECPRYKGKYDNNEQGINGLFMGIIMIKEDVCKVDENNEDQEVKDVFVGTIECEKKNLSLALSS